MKTLVWIKSLLFDVKYKFLEFFKFFAFTSEVPSKPDFNSFILFVFISYPVTL